MAVGRVYHYGVGTGVDKGLHAVERVDGDAHAGGHAQAALLVFACHGLVLGLGYVLVGYQAHKVVVFVYHRQLLDLVLLQYLGCGGQVGLHVRCHEVVFRHHVVHLLVQVALKAQVAVGDDAHQVVVFVYHGYAADMVFCHHVESVLDGGAAAYGHGVVYHSVLCTLHDCHLAGLLLDGHVLVDDADAALTSYGYGHLRLGDGVHGRGHEWHVKLDVAREPCFQLHCLGQHV